MTDPADIVARFRTDTLAVADEIVRLRHQAILLRSERDEARKLLCDEIWMSRGGRMSVDAIAKERGWDCFKENTND